MSVVYDPELVFGKIKSLVSAEPELYEQGFRSAITDLKSNPQWPVSQLLDQMSDEFWARTDDDSPEYAQSELVYDIGRFFGYVATKSDVVIQGVENV